MREVCLEADLSFGCAFVFVCVPISLHKIKPELDPSWHMISEYAIGRYGWMMRLGLLSLSMSCLAQFSILIQKVATPGDILLAIIAIGPMGSAIFKTDPITTPWREVTLVGRLHAGFAALFVTGFPIA